MTRIQSDVGLITGVKIGETVEKLMAVAARPRELLLTRTAKIKQEQAALTELSALLVATEYASDNLGKAEVYRTRAISSTEASALAATVTGQPPTGTFQYTPLRTARSQQLLSGGFATSGGALAAGTLTFRTGDRVDRASPLALFGTTGLVRGKIRITDRSGATGEIDLTKAVTLDDVLAAINGQSNVDVRAAAHGDGIRLTDVSGQSVSNLKVAEVGGGTTAASLGLAGIDVAAGWADGQAMIRLSNSTAVSLLNDGNALQLDRTLGDINFTLRDGTTGTIDFARIVGTTVDEELTLGDIVETINAAGGGDLVAAIDPDGLRLKLTDTTEGNNTFQLAAAFDSHALEDLGLDVAAGDGEIVGRRLVGGAGSVLLSSLRGGQGVGALGAIDLTDRAGRTAMVDLSGAETLEDVIDAINAATTAGADPVRLGIVARVNAAGNGLELIDTSGSGAMIVASAGGQTAEALGLAVNAAVAAHNSGDLALQSVAQGTALAALNGGGGVARGSFTLVDTAGVRATIDLSNPSIRTVGDAIAQINRSSAGVLARLNDSGDGILITDTAHGAGTLSISEAGGTTARDLGLLRTAQTRDVGGTPTQVIDGRMTVEVAWKEGDTLSEIAAAINAANPNVWASVIQDGSALPFRLAISSQRSGAAGRMVVDASAAGFAINETVSAQDALLAVGDAAAGAAPMLIASRSNVFADVLGGASLEIKQATGRVVNVAVTQSDADVVASVRVMVENYNKFRERLGKLTAYDATTNARGVLTGSAAALRLEMDLSRALSGRFGDGTIRSLGQVGISFGDDGSLELDETRLKATYAAQPDAVESFFRAETSGFSARLHATFERLAGIEGSVLGGRLSTLENQITRNDERAATLAEQLKGQADALYLKFYRMELAIGKMQNSLNALAAIQAIAPLSSSSSST